MVWEDIEDEELELLEEARYPARRRYYSALNRGLLGYIIALGCVVGLLLFGLWVFDKAAGW